MRDVLWKEIARWIRNLDPFFRDQLELTVDRLYHKKHPRTWFAVARTARKENPEALQGFHGTEENPLMFIIDEASGVPEEIFAVVRGALTDKKNRVVMCSNPTRVTGFFYNTQVGMGKMWKILRFNAEESPLVSKESCEEYARDYGKESDVYRVRVLGEFPVMDDNTLIPHQWVNQAFEREAVYIRKTVGKKFDSAGVDVARYGENKTAIVLVQNISVVALRMYDRTSTMKTAGMVANLAKNMEHSDIKVDASGVGGGVIDRLQEQDIFVTEIDNGSSAHDKTMYANRRSELYWNLRKRFESGEISLKPLLYNMSESELHSLQKQLTSLKFEYNSAGKIQVWTKEKMRREGIESPDMADALMLAFADYEPEIAPKKPKTEAQRLIDSLEQVQNGPDYDTHEMHALDYWEKKSREYNNEPEETKGVLW